MLSVVVAVAVAVVVVVMVMVVMVITYPGLERVACVIWVGT